LGEDVPLAGLFTLLFVLLLLSAFFSSSETALMSLNRYRLRHKARAGHRGARLAETLLQQPDRLIGLILLGNNLVNISAASLVAFIALQLGGEAALALGTFLLTLVVLIFAETAPKTFAALQPEGIAYPAAYVYYPLLKVVYPLVWLVNVLSNGVLYVMGYRKSDLDRDALSAEELRTVVHEAGSRISRKYRTMLLNILDLEQVTVDDVMVPHNEVIGIDLDDDMDVIINGIRNSRHTRLPVYRDSIDKVIGVLHLRKLANLSSKPELTKKDVEASVVEPYFVPEGTPLNTQLVQFQKSKQRIALVVDEYGDIQGIVTLEDILEEIVGEFTTDPAAEDEDVVRETDTTTRSRSWK
jgi:Mg2+/Co2+ transporter CorB